VFRSNTFRPKVGVLFEAPYLFEELTVYENLKVFAKLMEMPRSKYEPKISELLDFTGIAHYRSSPARILSKGTRQS